MLPREFIETLSSDMGMRTADWLVEQQEAGVEVILLDLRSPTQFAEGHIEGTRQISINDLPGKLEILIPRRETVTVLHCSGSIQSAMAVMYLRTEGYRNSFNLSGGYSSWVRNNRPVVTD